MAQGQRWAAMGEDKLPLPVPAQVTLGQAAPAHLCWHTGVVALEGRMPTWLNTRARIALPTLTRFSMATTGTSTARGAAARLLPCPSHKHSTYSNTNQMRKGGLCFPPSCCFLLFSSAF